MDLKQGLLRLGLRAKEVDLYLALIDAGRSTAQPLSKRAGMTRSTAYFILEGLLERGLVAKEQRRGTTYFVAHPPAALVQALVREEEEAHTRRRIAEKISEELLPRFKDLFSRSPRMQLVEGKPGVQGLLRNSAAAWHHSMLAEDKTWWGFEDAQFVKHHDKWFREVWEAYDEERRSILKVRVFSDPSLSRDVQKRFPLTKLRSFPTGVNFPSTLWLMGNYLALFVITDRLHYAYQLEDRALAASLRVVFQLLWQGDE